MRLSKWLNKVKGEKGMLINEEVVGKRIPTKVLWEERTEGTEVLQDRAEWFLPDPCL